MHVDMGSKHVMVYNIVAGFSNTLVLCKHLGYMLLFNNNI